MTPQRFELLRQLLKAGCEVIDFTSALQHAHRAGQSVVSETADPHLTPNGAAIVARLLSDRLRRYESELPKDNFKKRCVEISNGGNLLRVEQIQRLDGTVFSPSKAGELLLCGDSNLYWWQTELAEGSGISAHLAYVLQTPIDEISRSGFRPHQMSQFLTQAYSKRAVIFLQSSWVLWNKGLPYQLLP